MNTNEPKVSIIIPIYNAKKYLEKCLNSLISQSLDEIEIICIDDGSDDGSWEILRDYASRDKRIKILKGYHDGPSRARNIGLLHATGHFISFVDSDDYVDSEMLYEMFQTAVNENSDCVVCGMQLEYESAEKYNQGEINWGKSWHEGSENIDSETFGKVRTNVLDKLFRRSVIQKNKINFPEDIKFNEDGVFVWCFLLTATEITFLKKDFYHYLQRDNSTMARIYEKKDDTVLQIIDSWEKIATYINKNNKTEYYNQLSNLVDEHIRHFGKFIPDNKSDVWEKRIFEFNKKHNFESTYYIKNYKSKFALLNVLIYIYIFILTYFLPPWGDDFIYMSNYSWHDVISASLKSYVTWNSRLGEFFGYYIGSIFNSKIIFDIINPIIQICIIYLSCVLITGKKPYKNKQGILLYIFSFIGVTTFLSGNGQCTYWFAGAINHSWPVVFVIYLIILLKNIFIYSDKKIKYISLFICSIITTWYSEALSAPFLMTITSLILYCFLKEKKNKLLPLFVSFSGGILGLLNLYIFSPATSNRSKGEGWDWGSHGLTDRLFQIFQDENFYPLLESFGKIIFIFSIVALIFFITFKNKREHKNSVLLYFLIYLFFATFIPLTLAPHFGMPRGTYFPSLIILWISMYLMSVILTRKYIFSIPIFFASGIIFLFSSVPYIYKLFELNNEYYTILNDIEIQKKSCINKIKTGNIFYIYNYNYLNCFIGAMRPVPQEEIFTTSIDHWKNRLASKYFRVNSIQLLPIYNYLDDSEKDNFLFSKYLKAIYFEDINFSKNNITLSDCVIDKEKDGYLIESFSEDPYIVINSVEANINGELICCFLLDSSIDSYLQLFYYSNLKTTFFTEENSISIPYKKGIRCFLFCLKGFSPNEKLTLRLDPGDKISKWKFLYKEKIL